MVQFNQTLRSDLFERLLETEQTTDLTICVGTSLSGMNADRVVKTPAKKFAKKGEGFGSVIINLQRTPLDSIASLRIWADIDTVFCMLAEELSLPVEPIPLPNAVLTTLCPYDADGIRDDSGRLMLLDVRPLREVVSGQPGDNNFRHRKGATTDFDKQENVLMELKAPGKLTRVACLGSWWMNLARDGAVKCLPVRNVDPIFLDPTDALCQIRHSSRRIAQERFEWSLSVESNDLPIAEVHFSLHETFNPSEIVLNAAPFKICRTGWGTFVVPIRVVFVDYSFVEFAHELDFGVETGLQSIPVKDRKL